MKDLIKRLEDAYNRFNNAVTPGQIDAAIYEINSIEVLIQEHYKRVKDSEEG